MKRHRCKACAANVTRRWYGRNPVQRAWRAFCERVIRHFKLQQRPTWRGQGQEWVAAVLGRLSVEEQENIDWATTRLTWAAGAQMVDADTIQLENVGEL